MAAYMAYESSFSELSQTLKSLFVINPVTLVAGFLGYRGAQELQVEQTWGTLFKKGCIIAIKAAVFGGFLLMVGGIMMGYLGYEFGVGQMVGIYLTFLFGCVLFIWLILPVAGVGSIMVYKILQLQVMRG